MPDAIELDETSETIRITDLEIDDRDVYNYFTELDPDERSVALRRVVKVGTVALRASETGGEVDYVERRFSELQHELESKFEETFGEEGHVREYIENQIGEDGRLVNELLSPNEPDSPMHRLLEAITDDIGELRREIVAEEVREEMVQQTSLKGDRFEENLEELLGLVAEPHGDKLEFTGEDIGEIEASKKGDFVITVGDIDSRIVVEAKNMSYNLPQIEEEMEEAIRNRSADYGLFIARSVGQLPNKVGWFNEYDGDYLVVALSEGDDESAAAELVKVAYRWARMRVLQKTMPTGDDIDTAEIQSQVQSAERTLDDFRNIRTKLTNIEDSADDIRDILGDIEQELFDQLNAINSQIQAEV